jgi:NTE family protein
MGRYAGTGLAPALRTGGVTLLAAIALTLACSTPGPRNEPIEAWSPSTIFGQDNLASPERSGEILLVLTFSGGGTRAAAFSYGVLRELAKMEIEIDGEPRRLVDEVDLISSVSGGSFTAAYFGLRGNDIFESYEEAFLRKNVQRGLFLELLRPLNLFRIPHLDRSQLAARYYDRHIFDGARFADLRRPGAPEVVLNTTDLSTLSRFPFSETFFGLICSDLASYPIASAVTASSAVPGVFRTVRLRNRAGTCGFDLSPWLKAPASGDDGLVRLAEVAILSSYLDTEARPYIHLLDGGLTDNLGLRNAVSTFRMVADPAAAMRAIGHEDARLILIVTVNAESGRARPWDQKQEAASTLQVLNGMVSASMHNTNLMTLEGARMSLDAFVSELPKSVRYAIVEVSFEQMQDPEERARLEEIETSFTLNDEKVDRLISAGRALTRASPGLREALRDFATGEASP